MVHFGKEASQTRDGCVAKNATLRAARPDSSLRKERWLGMTIKLRHCLLWVTLARDDNQATFLQSFCKSD
jgi:hypothetical protein